MKKHTPGPWQKADKFKESLQPVYHKLKSKPVAYVAFDELPDDEARANAKLIAAAPELLEALDDALKILGRRYEPKEDAEETVGSRLYLKMQAAIKKATE